MVFDLFAPSVIPSSSPRKEADNVADHYRRLAHSKAASHERVRPLGATAGQLRDSPPGGVGRAGEVVAVDEGRDEADG